MVKTSDAVTKRLAPFQVSSPFFYDFKIEPGVLLKRFKLYLLGTISFAGGASSGTSQGENPGGLIAKIEVDANPKANGKYQGGKIVSLTPNAIMRQRIFDRGFLQDDLNLGATGVVGAATSYIVALELPIEFSLPRSESPDDTSIRLDEFDSVTLKVTTAAITDMLSGNDRTATVTGLYFEVVEDREYAPGFYPIGTLYQDDRDVQIVNGANPRLAIDSILPQGDAYVSALLIAKTTSKALSDAIINAVDVKSGSETLRSMLKFEIKGQQRAFVTDYAQSMTGLHYIEIAKGGRLANAQKALSLVCDVANPGTDVITVLTRRLQLRAKAA